MEFYRSLLGNLVVWKDTPDRKPLVLHGARQVGKTWLLETFGKKYFQHMVYINFERQDDMKHFFESDKDPKRIISQLSLYFGYTIRPEDSLIVLDEIQECKAALRSLKYFCEEVPEYAVICAGSLLGVSMAQGDSFPVGKVDHMKLYPLTFKEFLYSVDSVMYDYLETLKQVEPLPEIFFHRIHVTFLKYLICGGMPSAAKIMAEETNSAKVDTVLHGILNDYRLDFFKHSTPSLIPKLSHIWDSLPSQLARENKKFLYQLIRPGARAREYEDALLWLKQAGLIYSVTLNKTPKLPLKAYDDLSAFKIYLSDIGLLRTLSDMPASVILSSNNNNYVEFKGASAENYVLQSLSVQFDVPLRYWTSKRNAEVDFLLQNGEDIIPIEVKSGFNIHGKSLKVYGDQFHPKYKIRYSIRNLSIDSDIINIPLFLCDYTGQILSSVSSKQLD